MTLGISWFDCVYETLVLLCPALPVALLRRGTLSACSRVGWPGVPPQYDSHENQFSVGLFSYWFSRASDSPLLPQAPAGRGQYSTNDRLMQILAILANSDLGVGQNQSNSIVMQSCTRCLRIFSGRLNLADKSHDQRKSMLCLLTMVELSRGTAGERTARYSAVRSIFQRSKEDPYTFTFVPTRSSDSS